MKSQYISELKPGHTVKEKFILTKKILKDKKEGGIYALLEFTDCSGSIEGIAWNSVAQDSKTLSLEDFVFVSGNVNEYNEKLEIVVNSIERVPDNEIDPIDFLPKSEDDIDKVMKEIDDFLGKIINPYLKRLVELFFQDQEFVKKFKSAPAAKRVHHAYLGGLAVHTLQILKLLSDIQTIYKSLNPDLLIAGGVFHDIGKIHEYHYTKKIDITTRGKMIGHIVIGYEMIMEKIAKIPQFPEDLKVKVLHMILSHHGEFEWGSPKTPMFPEALMLHLVDNLDAKATMMIDELKKNRGHNKEWSDYHPYLEREIYLQEEE